jgi:hypothetical protein
MRRKKEKGNEKGGNLFLIEQVQRNALCVAHCAAIFIYSYSSSHNIQLLIGKIAQKPAFFENVIPRPAGSLTPSGSSTLKRI